VLSSHPDPSSRLFRFSQIRTPLNGVIGLSELLLDIESLSDEARGLVSSILRSSGALLTVINDVLDFSKVDAGKLDLTPSPMSLRTVCLDVVWTYRRIWASKGIAFDVNIDQLPEEKVLGDAGRLTQVLNNLFGNAGKFTEEGTISFLALKIPSSASSSLPQYSFTITDTGCGIAKDQQEMLFQPFRQADPSTSRRFGGSGLGLAICKNLIELMGGTIALESEENVGTTIHIDIPFTLCPPGADSDGLQGPAHALVAKYPSSGRLPSTEKEPVPVSLPQSKCSTKSKIKSKSKCHCPLVSGTSKGHVLLAEDNEINAQIAVKTLHKLGYDVSCAENGVEVLELLDNESKERPFSMLLLDCMMPVMDGFTCSRRIRASNNERHRSLPIIAAPAAVVGGRELCLAAGMTDFLSKPMRRAALDAMLTKWVGKTHEDRQDVGIDQ
jgi:CheY-like chemotaxis protein